ncbi:MAG: glycosyltransferase family 4 protein [Ahrensia sp.]|nr:glycosyltransferase family 4 protein [Ahrensia sp.]
MSAADGEPALRIMHCFRSPVGGIFRHVRDLIDEQIAEGHQVGIICDDNTGGNLEESLLEAVRPKLALGLHRVSMERAISPSDLAVTWKLYRQVKALNLDILHSHGAKGGAYARIIGTLLRMRSSRPARLYCPHGGSIHYDKTKIGGRVFFTLERIMERFTDRLIFVSSYEKNGYFEKVGEPPCPWSLVYNGLTEAEFDPVEPAKDATDFLYVGMMRDLKGVDLFLDALPLIADNAGPNISATLVGEGPDLARYKDRAKAFDERIQVRFFDAMPVREAFKLGRVMVVPSRAESMPYIVLEALAARIPLVATRVGGIPEIYAEHAEQLVEPASSSALAQKMGDALHCPSALSHTGALLPRIKDRFSTTTMAASIMDAYKATISNK